MARGPAMCHSDRDFMRQTWLALVFFSLLTVPAAPLGCAGQDPSPTGTAAPATTDTAPTEPPPKPAPTAETKPQGPAEAPAPVALSISPDRAAVGSVGPSVIVTGQDFVERSIVQLDGAPLATTYVSATELRATIPTPKLATVGALRVSVGTSPPGGGASKEVLFRVENPVPALTQLSPLSTVMGSADTLVTLKGTGFVVGSLAYFDSTMLSTIYVNGTTLQATVPEALLTTSGTAPMRVVNPPPGGGTSPLIAFTIANPNAAVQGVTPSSAFVGAGPITLALNGSGFISSSTVLFNGTSLTTTYVGPGQVTASLPVSLLQNAGDFPVAVNNPPPGGGVTTPVTFRVQYPLPAATSLTPASASAGAAPTVVTVNGTGFYPASQITIEGALAATTYVDGTKLRATLTAAQLATGGVLTFRVMNPSPGGGSSSALSFTVNNPAPSLTAIGPSTVPVGTADTTITLSGASFIPGSTARANGAALATGYVSASQLTALVPSSYFMHPGNVSITVTSPAPGGGTSGAQALVVGCDTSGVDVSLTALGQVAAKDASWATAPLLSKFDASGSCETTVIDTVTKQPGRYWVVQNMTGAPITLSAWADCSAVVGADAYLTFYKRPSAPASDYERLACHSYIAEGINGYGGYSSPEAGGSMWCPGLTKANGGGMALGVCEKVVVHAQPWNVSSTSYPPPPSFKIKAE